MGQGGTTLFAAGLGRRTLIRIRGAREATSQTTAKALEIQGDVPVGAVSFHVKDAGGLKPGDLVRIRRPSTKSWIERLGATDFGGDAGGGWKPGSQDVVWERSVESVHGDDITVRGPITVAIETQMGGARLGVCTASGRIANVGVENLRLESAFDPNNANDENHSWCAITLEEAQDAWVRQVEFHHFAGSAVAVYEACKQITVEDCISLAPVSEVGGYRRHTFFTMGQQTLFLRCYAEQGRHDFSVGHCAGGPNAFVQCEARGALADSGPIESWASGVLYDNVSVDGNALTLGYRPGNNAGIGWAAANCVLWNCSASVVRCWNPPGAQNWSFGSWGSFEGDGVWRSSNDFMSPPSLFAAQVKDRLGAEAAARLQLMARSHEESSNPSVDKAQELAAASHRPAAQLSDYILTAGQRDPIACEPGDAKRPDDLSLAPGFSQVNSRGNDGAAVSTASREGTAVETAHPLESAHTGLKSGVNEKGKLVLSNGWLTCGGKLLTGGTLTVAWWRGSVRPEEAGTFGAALTRFVPGRTGPGFTDDLEAVADEMIAGGRAALDHNYGLWYDRRRDDHERVRRINGDVLPPFFEQPFARTGQGTAWLGLSKYDLTKFNPWYWSRLQEFANLAEARGLVLFHQNYFQHNILEAGAHWADCPWRTVNNINHTDFPEPPPYAGDKRIFMAELFYDVSHPVRRELHRGYIRQCLDNFTNQANVIQFTSAEFTGPLKFMEFWLDTVATWERERGRRELVALSATKDVEDAILADPKRSATVDVVDFRYWWRTDKGLFAPPGGKNLAPRQFERQWRGGKPNDANLAAMAAEYRDKCAGKALICDFDSAGWVWLCAGGSLPRLPQTTDRALLAAIPRMRPWGEASRDGHWILREKGRQVLAFLGKQPELDLSDEIGAFRVSQIDMKTGKVTAGDVFQAGGKVTLPAVTLVWLTRE
jgi:hypothetical protein